MFVCGCRGVRSGRLTPSQLINLGKGHVFGGEGPCDLGIWSDHPEPTSGDEYTTLEATARQDVTHEYTKTGGVIQLHHITPVVGDLQRQMIKADPDIGLLPHKIVLRAHRLV